MLSVFNSSIAGIVGHFLINQVSAQTRFSNELFSENRFHFFDLELETMVENPTRIIGLVIVLRVLLWRGQEKFLDMPSIIYEELGSVMDRSKGDDSILTKFGDGCVRGAWIGF